MLKLTVLGEEHFDEETSEFTHPNSVELELEHSLVSISKWESKWEVPFLSDKTRTDEQTYDYIKCMSVGREITDEILKSMSQSEILKINEYINKKMTATWFPEEKKKPGRNGEATTSELIYHWMIALTIPVEFQHWHLNRLLTLIQVCNKKNQPEKKMSRSELAQRNKALNEARRAKMNTKG